MKHIKNAHLLAIKFKTRIFIVIYLFLFIFNIQASNISLKTEETGSLKELPFVFIVMSYNNSDWVELNLRSLLTQNYRNYRIIYFNDCSSDETEKKVRRLAIKHTKKNHLSFNSILLDNSYSVKFAKESPDLQKITPRPFFTLVNNIHRGGALCNLYRGVSNCLDEEIVVVVDGDDWLFDNTVLEKLNKAYSSNDIWLTHGNLIEYPNGGATWCEPVPNALINSNAFRTFKCPSHLRTFYAWLFRQINLEDLLYDGDFFQMTSDQATMFPMIEMAGNRHLFIHDILYVYNMKNSLNDNKTDPQKQRDLEAYIRSAPPYQRLPECNLYKTKKPGADPHNLPLKDES